MARGCELRSSHPGGFVLMGTRGIRRPDDESQAARVAMQERRCPARPVDESRRVPGGPLGLAIHLPALTRVDTTLTVFACAAHKEAAFCDVFNCCFVVAVCNLGIREKESNKVMGLLRLPPWGGRTLALRLLVFRGKTPSRARTRDGARSPTPTNGAHKDDEGIEVVTIG
jgi:hypothetical protein